MEERGDGASGGEEGQLGRALGGLTLECGLVVGQGIGHP